MDPALILRGDIYYAEFEYATGSEISGIHPIIIVQNNLGNYYSRTIIGVVMTSKAKKAEMPTHEMISDGGELIKNSMVLAEHIYTVDKQRLRGFICHLDDSMIVFVDNAIRKSLAL